MPVQAVPRDCEDLIDIEEVDDDGDTLWGHVDSDDVGRTPVEVDEHLGMCACMRACVHACMHPCVCMRARVYMHVCD